VSSSPTDTQVIEVTMPQMGVSVAEGTVIEWRKAVGDTVAADETICEISTDKIDSEVPSPAAGTVTELLVDVGETVTVGTVLARIATGSEGSDPSAALSAVETLPGAVSERPRRYSPVVQRIAAEHGIDLESVEGTGRGGRVRKQDVLSLVGDNGAAPEPPMHIESPYRPDPAPAGAATGAQPLSRMRRSIGEHMLRSLQTAAHCTTIVEADMARIETARARVRLSYLPFVARAVIDALRVHPSLNATLEGEQLTVHEAVHLGIAVSLGEEGLIVPVVHDAQELSAEGLGARIKELARRARANELTPDDVTGATFTITNPGLFGAIAATPIINQPQVAILDLEAVVKRPVVVTGPDGDDVIAIRPMTNLCMSWDHRALDGALAAQFLSSVKRGLEGWSGG
jgi:pyruvate/2-oxoglutarate dehydrogenase complex dihydrolipoamide acyltransferase (E2) component